MAREYFDHDPLTGLVEYLEFADGKMHLTYEQDVEALLDNAKALANEGISDAGFKGEAWHYSYLPDIVIMQMRAKGIDVFDQNHIGRVVREINENYPHLKTTHRYHAVK